MLNLANIQDFMYEVSQLPGNYMKTEPVNSNFKTQHLVKPKQTGTPMREHAGKIPYSM